MEISTFPSNNGNIETYLFDFDESSNSYITNLPLPVLYGRYNATIILLDSNNSKIKDVSGWINLPVIEEEKIVPTSTAAVVASAAVGLNFFQEKKRLGYSI